MIRLVGSLQGRAVPPATPGPPWAGLYVSSARGAWGSGRWRGLPIPLAPLGGAWDWEPHHGARPEVAQGKAS